jgi:hypothetical protein
VVDYTLFVGVVCNYVACGLLHTLESYPVSLWYAESHFVMGLMYDLGFVYVSACLLYVCLTLSAGLNKHTDILLLTFVIMGLGYTTCHTL